MHCIKCGAELPPEMATCPSCGASTPYNVTPSSPRDASVEAPPPAPNSPVEETASTPIGSQSQEPSLPPSLAERIVPQQEPQPAPDWQQPQPISPSPSAQSLPMQQEAQPQASSPARILLLTIFVLLIIGGSGLIYYVTIGRPAEFHAQATAIAQTLLTPMAPQDVYTNATRGKPTINDPLNNPSNSTWSQSRAPGNGCTFTSGAYHLNTSGNNLSAQCFSSTSNLSDFAFQVQVAITQRSGAGGLIFRADGTQSNFYNFFVSPNGFYELDLVANSRLAKLLNYGPSSAINSGLNQPNLLTVIAHGSTIYLYANKQNVATLNDSTYRSGGIGLFAFKGTTSTGDVAFSNAQVWKL